jgi:hypothetical protein
MRTSAAESDPSWPTPPGGVVPPSAVPLTGAPPTGVPPTAAPPTGAPSMAEPPDWSSLSCELECPLCNYNLRGLAEPRCPECGFTFEWSELQNAQRNRHPYLFEHQPRHNLWSFWKTFWADCRPRRFWRELSPANPVRLGRLMIYWLGANIVLLGVVIVPVPLHAWADYQTMLATRRFYFPVPGRAAYSVGAPFLPRRSFVISAAQLDALAPLPTTWRFWWRVFTDYQYTAPNHAALLVLLWPWATLASLLIFQASMRRAKINKLHVVRAAIYSCDFGLLFLAWITVTSIGIDWNNAVIQPVIFFCAAVALYRLSFAYKLYMRFHAPFLTVLASQVMVLLTAACVQLNVHW